MSAETMGIIEFYFTEILSNSSPHFIRSLFVLLNLIGCGGNINGTFPKMSAFRKT